jgi:hypothetical protein
MEEILERIATYVSHGSLPQFRTEIGGYLTSRGYDSEIQAEELLIYRPHKEGGFLGIGAKTIKEPLLRISTAGGSVTIPEDPRDEELVQYLNSVLHQH